MKSFLQNALLLFFSVFLALALFEVSLVFFYFGKNNHPSRDLALISFYAEPGSTVGGVSINRQGFTGDTVDHPKQPGTVRVLTLGGSVLFNLDMSARIKQSIQSVSPYHVELMGAALRSHTSASSLIKYKSYLQRYDFDTVLVYEGINDLWPNHYDRNDFRMDYSHYLSQYRRNLLLDNCYTCRILYEIYFVGPEYLPSASGYLSAQALERNLRELIGLVRQRNARPVLMTFAYFIPDGYSDVGFLQGQAGYSRSTDPEGDYWPISIWGEQGYVSEGLRRHNEVVRKLAKELDVDLIDQEQAFAGLGRSRQKYFGDICHFTSAGADFFVANIREYFAVHPVISGRR